MPRGMFLLHLSLETYSMFLKNPQGSHKILGGGMLSRELMHSLDILPVGKASLLHWVASSVCSRQSPFVPPAEDEGPGGSPSPAGAAWWRSSCQDMVALQTTSCLTLKAGPSLVR